MKVGKGSGVAHRSAPDSPSKTDRVFNDARVRVVVAPQSAIVFVDDDPIGIFMRTTKALPGLRAVASAERYANELREMLWKKVTG